MDILEKARLNCCRSSNAVDAATKLLVDGGNQAEDDKLPDCCSFIASISQTVRIVASVFAKDPSAITNALKENLKGLLEGLQRCLSRSPSSPDSENEVEMHLLTVGLINIVNYLASAEGSVALSKEQVGILLAAVSILSAGSHDITATHTELVLPSTHEEFVMMRKNFLQSRTSGLISDISVPPSYRTALMLKLLAVESGIHTEAAAALRKEAFSSTLNLLDRYCGGNSAKSMEIYTEAIIRIARIWNGVPSAVQVDKVAAHALLQLLPPSGPVKTLNSAAFTALVPIAMRLLDRYDASLHSLGLLLLYRAVAATPPGLLATFQEWVVPHIYQHIEVVDDDWSRLLAARVLHALLASDLHTSVALQHLHLYLETSIRLLMLKPTVQFAWPYLLHLQVAYAWMPEAVLACHLTALIDCYLQLLNVWHLPMQCTLIDGLQKLTPTATTTSSAGAYIPKIASELIRVLVFYHSDQRDLSGADAASISGLVAQCREVAACWRQADETAWDAFVASMKQEVQGGEAANSGANKNRQEMLIVARDQVLQAITLLIP